MPRLPELTEKRLHEIVREVLGQLLEEQGLPKGRRLALTYDEAAEACGCSTTVVRRAIGRGDLTPSYATRTKPVIRVAELQRWLRALTPDRIDY